MKDIFKEVVLSNETEFGSIGIISLGSDTSCQLKHIGFLDPKKILTYNSYSNVDKTSVKHLCGFSDIVFVVVNLDDISVVKSIWGLISIIKSLDTNMIIIAKTSLTSLNLAKTLQKQVPFLDLFKQENSDLIWILKSLHKILYYYNDEYNWSNAHYPPRMFWEDFFNINSEIFIFQGDNATSLLEKIDKNKYLNKRLIKTKHCVLRGSNNIVSEELSVLADHIGNDDTYFYCKKKEINDLLLLVSF